MKSKPWVFRKDLYDRSDPTAVTSMKDLMTATGLTRNTINIHLPLSEFKRENKNIIGIKPVKTETKLSSVLRNLTPLLISKPIPVAPEVPPIVEQVAETLDEIPEDLLEKASMPVKRGRPAKPIDRANTIQTLYESIEKSRQLNDTIAKSYNDMLIETKVQKKEQIPIWLKSRLWTKENGSATTVLCPICKDSMISSDSFSTGHIIPESMGGPISLDNLMAICYLCNSQMGSRHLYWFAWKYYHRIFWQLV